jgi:hypothetical protein
MTTIANPRGPRAAHSARSAHSPRSSGGPRLVPRVLLLVPAGITHLAGLDAALMLVGVPAPVRVDRLPEVHGC